jgi:site-specific DNA recombinase
MAKFIAVYCRLSPRPDGGYEGVELQEKWGREYAASAWPDIPVEVFADTGISASNGDHRPEFERFRRWVAEGRVAQVWTVEQSRLERREAEWFTLAAELDAAGITDLHTNRDGVVRVRDEVAGIKAVLAAGETRKLKKRVNDRLAELAAEGRPPGGRTFGYERVRDDAGGKTLRIIPDQAEILRDAAGKILAGWSLSNVAADLTRRGVRGANGAKITYKTLNRMVTNPTVAGYRVYRGAVVGRGVWDPILDEQTWQLVRAKLAQPRTVRTGNGGAYDITEHQYGAHSTRTRRRYLLTGGIAICGVCRTAMRAQRRKVHGERLDALYTCWHGFHVGVMADPLEQCVADRLLDELDKPEFLQAVAADDQADRRSAILAELTDTETRRGELAQMWATPGELTAAEWRTARQAITEHEQALRRELAELPPPLVGVDMSQIRAAWPSMTLGERREIVELFISHVVVHKARPGAKIVDPDRVEIEWRAE